MELILPTDVMVADKFAPDADSKVCVVVGVGGWIGVGLAVGGL